MNDVHKTFDVASTDFHHPQKLHVAVGPLVSSCPPETIEQTLAVHYQMMVIHLPLDITVGRVLKKKICLCQVKSFEKLWNIVDVIYESKLIEYCTVSGKVGHNNKKSSSWHRIRWHRKFTIDHIDSSKITAVRLKA